MNRYNPLICLTLALPLAILLLTALVRADQGCLEQESWIFLRSRYSHDPESGVRIAQYAPGPVIEALPDPRDVTSGYNRTRSVFRGSNGSAATYYRVQSYGNGLGGLDAEWERFHDAWRGSTIAGGRYHADYGGYGSYYGHDYGYGGYGPGGYPVPYPGYGGSGTTRNHPGSTHPGKTHYGPHPGYWHPGYRPYPGYGTPDYRRLDPDGADGYPTRDRNRSDAEFFRPLPHDHYHDPAHGGGGDSPERSPHAGGD